MMKEALLKGELHKIGKIFDFGHKHKKNMASKISNNLLDEIYDGAKKAGATGGKIRRHFKQISNSNAYQISSG